jgi:aminoglycoside phosphotransferase (APT) family kinase protein
MSSTKAISFITPSRRSGLRSAGSPNSRARQLARQEFVGERVLQFFDIPGLSFHSQPEALVGGWEAETYALEFEADPNLPALLAGPLVLRIYGSECPTGRARREFAVQSFVHGHGFPCARPLLLVEDEEALGSPFMFMQRLPGDSLLHELAQHPWRLWDLPGRMADLHAQLHELPIDGFPGDTEDFLTRSLDEIRARIEAYSLEGLRAGCAWLVSNRPGASGERRILHLDWHPLNLIYNGSGLSAIDWSLAEVGDPLMDVATALTGILCYPMPLLPAWERPFIPIVRGVVARRYIRRYRRLGNLDIERLMYYCAWSAMRRLAMYGRWFCLGPAGCGMKPSAIHHVDADHCAALCSYFTRHSGVRATLDFADS